MEQYLPEGDLCGLDKQKQGGFYAAARKGGGFVAPREAIDPAFAQAVRRFAWRASTSIDFLLNSGNLERYIDNARTVRSDLTPEKSTIHN